MKRIPITPRNKWKESVEKLGFGFHTTNIPYWDESAYYEFTIDEITAIEKATGELWEMCLGAVQHVLDHKLYDKFSVPEWIVPYIEKTWQEDHPSLYGRFDFSFRDGVPKLLEFNADTPTSLFEAGIVQWFWLQDFDKSKDQFNSIHEKLIAYWKYLKEYLYKDTLYFTCVKQSLEDLTTVEYMRDCAIQAGFDTKLIFIDDIGWDGKFVDMDNCQIKNIFKLYPWEWLINDTFGKNIITDRAFWIEPAWRMILSNKAILPILYKLYPECPYILPAYFEDGKLSSFVKKPILSREGANIEVVSSFEPVEKTGGEYGKEGYIYQELCELPNFDNKYPVTGSWVIGQESAGIGIRESDTLVTNNTSRFIPHLIS